VAHDRLAARRQAAGLLVGQEEAVLLGQEEARGDRVDADVPGVVLAHVNGQPLREVADRGLGGRVRRDLRQRAKGVHAGDVQDVAGLLLGHQLAEDLGRQQGAQEVQVEDETDRVGRQIEERHLGRGGRFLLIAACAVDQDVDLAERRDDLVPGLLDRGLVQDVARDGDRRAALGLDRVGHLRRRGFGQVQDRHLGAACGQGLGHRAAQNPAATGYDHDFAFDAEHAIHPMPLPFC